MATDILIFLGVLALGAVLFCLLFLGLMVIVALVREHNIRKRRQERLAFARHMSAPPSREWNFPRRWHPTKGEASHGHTRVGIDKEVA